MIRRSGVRYILALYLLDLVALVSALLLARALRLWLPWGKPLDAPGIALPWPLFPVALVIWSVALSAARAYDPQRFADAIDEAQTVLAARVAAALALAGVLYLSHRGLSRLFYLYFVTLDAAFSLLGRLALRRLVQSRRLLERRRVLIVGAGPLAQRAARSLASFTWMGLQVVGYLGEDTPPADASSPKASYDSEEDYPLLGQVAQLEEVIAAQGVQEVVIALPQERSALLPSLLETLQALPVNVTLAPDESAWGWGQASLERIGDALLVGVQEPAIGPIERGLKRAFDVALAAIGLLALAPLMGLIALALRLADGGPVLYCSQRVGEGGRLFGMLKFRTMRPDADAEESALISESPDGQLHFAKRRDDPRITPVGRLLRRASLDELPQLWNVLCGEMSLVGPRPELPAIVARYTPWQRRRLAVPQGMTGWWQVSGRSDKDKHAHIEDDLYYIRHYSLLLDLRILWRTLGVVLRGKGAY